MFPGARPEVRIHPSSALGFLRLWGGKNKQEEGRRACLHCHLALDPCPWAWSLPDPRSHHEETHLPWPLKTLFLSGPFWPRVVGTSCCHWSLGPSTSVLCCLSLSPSLRVALPVRASCKSFSLLVSCGDAEDSGVVPGVCLGRQVSGEVICREEKMQGKVCLLVNNQELCFVNGKPGHRSQKLNQPLKI